MLRCVILDDYQNVALTCADWNTIRDRVDVTVFNEGFSDCAALIEALRPMDIVCLMRERTPFPREVIEALPGLKLIVTTGMRNASLDMAAAKARGIMVCGTGGVPFSTAELAFGLILDLARNISREDAALKAGARWQSTLGIDLSGRTIGVLGLGRLGARVVHYARAFDMHPIAWSQNLTPERAREAGAEYVSKEALFELSDILSIHVVLSARTRGLVGAAELARMKPSALLVNTARGPIVDTEALIAALRENRLAGAAIDVFDEEPLPSDHPLRTTPNVVLTPHLGYVTRDTYRVFYRDTVEDIRAWLDGAPVRVVT